nr:intracellular protein transport protein USO1-like [Coffea arabica]
MEKTRDKLTDKALNGQEITEDKACLKVKVEELEQEIRTISSQKIELEDQIISTKNEAYHLKVDNENLHRRIFVLETTVKEREHELSALQKKIEAQENDMSTQIKSLTAQINNFHQKLGTLHDEKSGLQLQLEQEKQVSSESLNHMERKNIELTKKIADQQKTVAGLEEAINMLNMEHKQVQNRFDDSKLNFQIAERKIEEMAEEFFKKCGDNLRILSRRIRVAEQLHVENKEWYEKTKDRYEQQNKELKERVENNKVWLSNIKDMTLTADSTLSDLDAVALKFEGCSANFLNRISKVSCELKFAKDWIKRKNKAMTHVKDDLDCLLTQLDHKEAEILVFREKLWKSENKVRELEKMITENEEAMLALKEEKREAIRAALRLD